MSKDGICVVCFPYPVVKSGAKPINQLLEILKQNRKKVFFIGGNITESYYNDIFNNINYFKLSHTPQKSLIKRIISHLKTQIKISLAIIQSQKKISTYLFFIGAEGLLLPHIIAKFYWKRTFFLLAGFPSKGSAFKKDPFFFLENFFSKLNFIISNKILLYSPRIILERKLKFLKYKINVFCQSYISDSEIKYVETSKKDETIGFLGDVSPTKGIHNLFIAYKMLQKYNEKLILHIGGTGKKDFIKNLMNYADNNGFGDKIIFHGWINREDIPNFLSKIKYFILPSVSEGIPNVILEAMACGCCVISTSVGGIPDVITDNKNGFLIQENSPKSILNGILRAKSSDLNRISINAYNTIKNHYSFEKVAKKLTLILQND